MHIHNLSEKQLGGVIFGCKPDTFEECLTKQLFGLLSIHYVVVDQVNGERHNFEKDKPVNLHNEYTGGDIVDKIENEVHNNLDGIELQPERQTILKKLKELFFI
jgi:hypothetical protein